MQWWLSVFFLVGSTWVSGESIEGWGPRAYATEVDCQTRRQFAEIQTKAFPLDYRAVWVCNFGSPAMAPPAPTLEARDDHSTDTPNLDLAAGN
jgi:hypothetical protein